MIEYEKEVYLPEVYLYNFLVSMLKEDDVIEIELIDNPNIYSDFLPNDNYIYTKIQINKIVFTWSFMENAPKDVVYDVAKKIFRQYSMITKV